ncbi:MAG TPA: C39 family peptidase [Candidatus Binataceae bacterium]|nr:C39 family peptidase [Candidatus Binataceae bacterium]
MAGVLPGGAPIYTSIETFKDQRFHNLVPQGYDFSCGAAALSTVLKYEYGMNLTSENEVFRAMYAVGDKKAIRKRGFSLLDMATFLDTLGYHGLGYKLQPQALFDLKVPVIVLLNMAGYEHFVVMRKANPDYVYVADPALGNRIMPLESFLNDWVQQVVFAVVGPGYIPDNPLAVVERPLGTKEEARVLIPQLNPLTLQQMSILSVSTGISIGQGK